MCWFYCSSLAFLIITLKIYIGTHYNPKNSLPPSNYFPEFLFYTLYQDRLFSLSRTTNVTTPLSQSVEPQPYSATLSAQTLDIFAVSKASSYSANFQLVQGLGRWPAKRELRFRFPLHDILLGGY